MMSTYQLRHQPPCDWLSGLGSQSVAMAAFALADNQQPLASLRHHNRGSFHNSWLQLTPQSGFGLLLLELHRVLKPDRECFILLNPPQLAAMQLLAQAADFRLGPLRVVQLKNRRGNIKQRLLLHLRKGRPPAAWQQQQLLFELASDTAQFPHGLLEPLLQQCSSADELVIDPLLLDGSVATLALQQGRRFAGAAADADKFSQLKCQLSQLDNVTELMQQRSPTASAQALGQMPLL
ncbi:hypothetical protein [Ferrimonas senticii]|uniref:hypothetical protein n=1 Tax=Ferrimonas senticii TaxID=394566 RepID=UPI00042615C5|nr:hypothetical protein [Ferrimonas senticii]